MQSWHDLDVSYADKSKAEELMTLPIRPLKFTTCAGTGASVPWPQQYRCVHGIIDLIHIPAFTALGIKDLQNIGVYLKKIC
jgi:hypothetical protein